ncbi:MAG TPA: hypothetical protein VF444_18845 [Pseudonocardiaceae bacterium]
MPLPLLTESRIDMTAIPELATPTIPALDVNPDIDEQLRLG